MSARGDTLFITGATGLVGAGVLTRVLETDASIRAYALVRGECARQALLRNLGGLACRVTPVSGDVRRRGLGIDFRVRRALTREVTMVVHSAADTSFSRPLAQARIANTEGTRELVSLCRAFGALRRFAYVSTSYVAGRATGRILERDNGSAYGWVNAYERSKYEAEKIVRDSGLDWVIFRPSTIVCDSVDGAVSQVNAVHRALKVYSRGLAAMIPGQSGDKLDVVPADYVTSAIARITVDPRAAGATLHLCAGEGAMPLGDLLDAAYELWARDPMWRRRGVERVVMTDIDTYSLFTRSVIETGDQRLASILHSLSHFVPQLSLPKCFDTRHADAFAGSPAPVVGTYWTAMLEHLLARHWAPQGKAAA